MPLHLVEGIPAKFGMNPVITIWTGQQCSPSSYRGGVYPMEAQDSTSSPDRACSRSRGLVDVAVDNASGVVASYNGGRFSSNLPFYYYIVVADPMGVRDNSGNFYVFSEPSWAGSNFVGATWGRTQFTPLQKPIVSGIGPNITNDGKPKTVTVSLQTPIPASPVTQCQIWGDGLTFNPNTGGLGVPQYDGAGRITGWDFTTTIGPSVSGSVKIKYSILTKGVDYLTTTTTVSGGTITWYNEVEWATPLSITTGDYAPIIKLVHIRNSPRPYTPTGVATCNPYSGMAGSVFENTGTFEFGAIVHCEQQDIKSVVFTVYDFEGNVVTTSEKMGKLQPGTYSPTPAGADVPPQYKWNYLATWDFHPGEPGFQGDGTYTFGVVATDNTGNQGSIRFSATPFRCAAPAAHQFGAWVTMSDGHGAHYNGPLFGIRDTTDFNNTATGFTGNASVTLYPEFFAVHTGVAKAELYGPYDYRNLNTKHLLDTATNPSQENIDLNESLPNGVWTSTPRRPSSVPANGFGFSVDLTRYSNQDDREGPTQYYRWNLIPFRVDFYTDSGVKLGSADFDIPCASGRYSGGGGFQV